MASRGMLVRGALIAAVMLPCAVSWPSMRGLIGSTTRLDAPLDGSLRIPFAASYLRDTSTAFDQQDRVLGVTLPDGGPLVSPRSRAELYEELAATSSTGSLSLSVARNREAVPIEASFVRDPGWRRCARNWPTLFLAAAFLAFALAIALGSRHPVAIPLFAVSWCVGTSTLCQLDLLFPEDPGILGLGFLRGRLGLLSLLLLPAAILHLAMRFPVVSPRFRRPAVAAVPYLFWLFPAAFAQLRGDDAAFLNVVETIALGATFFASAVLVMASVTYARAMTPIERSRTLALLIGIGIGSAAPFVYFVSGGRPPAAFQAPLALSLLAFPAATSWAIVRYRLLDPPVWLQRGVLAGLTGAVSILLASAAVSMAFSLLDEPGPLASAEAVPVAITTTVLYELIQWGLRRGAAGRVLREGVFERVLEEASRELASARSPARVLAGLGRLIQTHLGASQVEHVEVAQLGAGESPALIRHGIELWRNAGSPSHRVVRPRARDEDPAPDLAEIVLPLIPESREAALVVLGSRTDGLPYTDEQERILASLLHVGTTALQAAATTADLEGRVAEKTISLERALQDRQGVLCGARAICEAADPQEVTAAVEAFVTAHRGQVHWEDGEAGGASIEAIGLTSDVVVPGRATRVLAIRGLDLERASEMLPQVRTLCTFAGLAIARLELLAELKREVERQAAELADLTSRRLHAEFVRGVAHELRKPTEEVRRGAEALLAAGAARSQDITRRLHAASREMSRRLDLLLFHSGLRLDRRRIDLVAIANDAVEAARATAPDRIFRLDHELARLPLVGDPSRLLSVLENLLDNAVKATSPGQPITVSTGIEPASGLRGPVVRLDVEDEGTGIDPERLDEIFEPGVAFAPSGFGLGLSLCREIVRMHDGRVAVESRPGKTVFHVWLPQLSRSSGGAHDDRIDPAG
jgi:signal transduction histidine kinase